MRNIHDHSQTFHLLDHLDPKRRQAFFRPKFYAFSCLLAFRMHIRTADLIGKIPGQCDHPHAQTVKISQIGKFSKHRFSFFDGQKSTHFSCFPVFHNILERKYRCDQTAVFLQFTVIEIRHFHCRLKGVFYFANRHKHGEILQKILSLFHFFQIYLKGIFKKSFFCFLFFFRKIKPSDGVTMHIYNIHFSTPCFCDYS